MKALFVGDTHGNTRWLASYIYPVAMTTHVDAIVVLGDFGAWEHTAAGIAFMSDVNHLSMTTGIPLYWLAGNHDNRAHTESTYEPEPRHGFLICREYVFYIPMGRAWTWGGVTLRAFGGAYSVDKSARIEREIYNYQKQLREAQYRKQATGVTGLVESTAGTLWFPEEEMTDSDMDTFLAADSSVKDIVLSHDKPFSAKPPWTRKDIPGCLTNQLRLERALRVHRPTWWLHGHLHYHYVDQVFGGGWGTTIVGLEPDDNAAEAGWRKANTWALAELIDGKVRVKMGHETFLDPETMQQVRAALS